MAADASADVVAALLAAGADPDAHDDDGGVSALRRAVRRRNQTVARLANRGRDDDSTDIDRFIGACLRLPPLRRAAPRRRTRPAGPPEPTDDRSAIVAAAGSASVAAIGVMLDLGFTANARNAWGETPLHNAAYAGNAAVVRLLIEAGADVDSHDARFDSTPLAFATVGSGERAGQPGSWTR